MKLKEFFEKFPTEQSCREHFKLYRDKEGVTCKKCGNTIHYWLSTIQQYKCKKCQFRTTLRSGTIMEHSHLPFQYWYIAMCLVTSTKKTFSALEIQKQIGHKFYEPIWDMMHKIRRAMGERDATYKLQDEVEVDDGFFEVVKTKEEKTEEAKLIVAPKKKRGKGSDKQQAVLVMVESRETANQNTHQPNKAISHIKMVTLDGLTASDIDFVSKKAIDTNAVITSDNATYYSNFVTNFKHHKKVNISKSETGAAFKRLPWVHKVIANAKRNFLGLHHSVGRGYLQNYLNEFAWKFNRRYTSCLFDRMLVTAVTVDFEK